MPQHVCKLATIPDCCGALVLHDLFENKWLELEDYGKTQEKGWGGITQKYCDGENKKNGNEKHPAYLKRIDDYIKKQCLDYKGRRSYILIALNEVQVPALEDIVLRNSFEVLVPQMVNPNGTKITLYIHYLLPKPGMKPEKKSILKKEIAY